MTNIPDTYYLVCDFGKAGRETVIDWEANSKADILRKIATQDYQGQLLEVHCISRDDGTWSDVSEDIAHDVLDALDCEPQGDLYDFLENALGTRTMAEMGREAWGAHTMFGAGA